ncbi:MAG: hypothetical protein NTW85_13645 [Methylococcales bacterium]|nr:hypothetical protein [Methylococcales bacterium]
MKFNDNQKKIGRIPDKHLDKEIPLPKRAYLIAKLYVLKFKLILGNSESHRSFQQPCT